MKNTVNLKALKINGHDPRLSKSFLLLSSKLSHLNGALPRTMDWVGLEEQCLHVFREYGYDLQSGVWFCLISQQLTGWKGLALALELLSVAMTHNGQRCWPPSSAIHQRQYLIDWFSTNVATHIYTQHYGPEDNSDMRRVESGINALCGQAKTLQSRSLETMNNLRYFMQVRCRSLPYPQRQSEVKATDETRAVVEVQEIAQLEKTREKEHDQLPVPRPRPILWVLGSMAAGFSLCASIALLWLYIQSPTLSEKLSEPVFELQQNESLLKDAWESADRQKLSEQKPAILQHTASILTSLSEQPTDALLRQGEILSGYLQIHYPGNEASAQWQRKLEEKAGGIPMLTGYISANQHLDKLEARLLNAELTRSQYLTVSELKTVVYQIRQDLQSNGIPAETLLWQIQQQKSQGEINPLLLKQASQRIESLNVMYFLISRKGNPH